jgi:hypothetical protein
MGLTKPQHASLIRQFKLRIETQTCPAIAAHVIFMTNPADTITASSPKFPDFRKAPPNDMFNDTISECITCPLDELQALRTTRQVGHWRPIAMISSDRSIESSPELEEDSKP